MYEVGISYSGRTYAEGKKKISWKDGVRAVWCVAKYGLKESRSKQGAVNFEVPQTNAQAVVTKNRLSFRC